MTSDEHVEVRVDYWAQISRDDADLKAELELDRKLRERP